VSFSGKLLNNSSHAGNQLWSSDSDDLPHLYFARRQVILLPSLQVEKPRQEYTDISVDSAPHIIDRYDHLISSFLSRSMLDD
jgi:hypothetical protein